MWWDNPHSTLLCNKIYIAAAYNHYVLLIAPSLPYIKCQHWQGWRKKRKCFSSLFSLKSFELHKAVMIIYSPSLLPKMPPTTLPPHLILQGYTSVLWKEIEYPNLDGSFYKGKDETVWKRFWVAGQSLAIAITPILTVFANYHHSALK